MIPRIFSLALLSVFVAGLCQAQRAQISGLVSDSSEAAIQNATINLIDEDTGFRRTAISDNRGEYAVGSLAPGTYKVTARKPGFQTVSRLNVKVDAWQQARVDFALQIGSMKEVITISGEPPLIESRDGAVETYIGQRWIRELPMNGRGILALLELAPGIVSTQASSGEAGQFSANGQRANANYFTVDGLSANSGVSGGGLPAQFSGGALPAMSAFGSLQTLASLDALDEVRVETSSVAPEYGRMPGAHVALMTRSGGNNFHGSLFYMGRNGRFDANDWFLNQSALAHPSSGLNQWGAALGGPVIRDRTFFFASYEGLKLRQPYTSLEAVPSLTTRALAAPAIRKFAEAFPLPNGEDFGNGLAAFAASDSRPSGLEAGSLRLDHALTARTSLFVRYNDAPSSTQLGYSQIEKSEFDTKSLSAGVISSWRADLTNDARINFASTGVSSRWMTTQAGGARALDFGASFPFPQTTGPVLYGFAIGGVGQLLAGANGSNKQGQKELSNTLSWMKGGHAARFGGDYIRLTPQRETVSSSVAGAYSSIADYLANRPITLSYVQADQASSLIEALSLFAQDSWRLTRKLTLTYGVRWELTPPPALRSANPMSTATPSGGATGSGSTGAPSTPPSVPPPSTGVAVPQPGAAAQAGAASGYWPTRYTQFAPRAGLAYQFEGSTVVRAGWGVFYDSGFSAAADPVNGSPYNRWQFVSAGLAAPYPQIVAPAGSLHIAPNLRIPYSEEWNLSVAHAFPGQGVFTVGYVGSAGRHLLRREGTSPTLGTAPAQTTFAGDELTTNHGASDYHALQLQYRRSIARGFQGMASYTWSHSIDNGSWDSGLFLVHGGGTALNDRGSSSFDARHGLTGALVYDFPLRHSGGLFSKLLNRWTIGEVLRIRSGFPIDVLESENVLGLGFDNVPRPNLVPGVPIWVADSAVPGGRKLNPSAFSMPPGSLQGSLGRNSIRGLGFAQLDLAVHRDFALPNEASVQVRAEAFNAPNHPSLADPVRFLDSPFFGQSTSMMNLMLGSGSPHSGLAPAFQSGGARTLQLALRFRF